MPQHVLTVKLIDSQRRDGMTPLWDQLYGPSAPTDGLDLGDEDSAELDDAPLTEIPDIRAEIAARRAAAKAAAA